jgi:hypothetical protein
MGVFDLQNKKVNFMKSTIKGYTLNVTKKPSNTSKIFGAHRTQSTNSVYIPLCGIISVVTITL